MKTSLRFVSIGALLLLTACGKVGSPDIPAGSTYPKIYPSDAARSRPASAAVSVGPVARFTPSGAWIDPDQHRPIIDSNADIDQKGSGGNLSGGAIDDTVRPATTGAGGGSTALPAP